MYSCYQYFCFNFLWENTCILRIWKLFAKTGCLSACAFSFLICLVYFAIVKNGYRSCRFCIVLFWSLLLPFLSPKMTYCDICTLCMYVPVFDGMFCSLFEFVCCCSVGIVCRIKRTTTANWFAVADWILISFRFNFRWLNQ